MLSGMRHTPALTPRTLEWSFADRLRKVRREVAQAGQAEFAQALDVNLKAYSAWESGKNTPRELVAVAKRIELVTGVPATWMLGISDVVVPAATGTDGAYASRVTARVTSEYVPGNSAQVIKFPLVKESPSGYPSKILGRAAWRKRLRTARRTGHPFAAAVV